MSQKFHSKVPIGSVRPGHSLCKPSILSGLKVPNWPFFLLLSLSHLEGLLIDNTGHLSPIHHSEGARPKVKLIQRPFASQEKAKGLNSEARKRKEGDSSPSYDDSLSLFPGAFFFLALISAFEKGPRLSRQDVKVSRRKKEGRVGRKRKDQRVFQCIPRLYYASWEKVEE